jgi:hypothetical protein
MPAITLVICVYQQGDLVARLLANSAGCYDDLVVVHDGPDTTDVRSVVEKAGGRFFERPRECQQEPHWPFAWGEARHDWILRLDADEFPSDELKSWLVSFRQAPQPAEGISGYTCIWPVWSINRSVTKHWPAGRNFLFDRRQVLFFGMPEQTPIPDGRFEEVNMVLRHEQTDRKSHGLRNLLVRKQAYLWRNHIARSLLGRPTDLVCWRWDDSAWPEHWEQIRRRPVRAGIGRLLMGTLRGLRDQWRVEKRWLPVVALSGPLNHALICAAYWRLRRTHAKTQAS